jgi:3-phenylpropionate/trans-cinnamate dioxygenase ferredoxin reductase subunit
MKTYRYIIVGGGMGAAQAMRGIRQVDRVSPIALFSAERYPPYNRPPLSKKLWQGDRMESIWPDPRRTPAGVAFHLGVRVTGLDAGAKQIEDEWGTRWGFEKLLLVTGGTPLELPGSPPGVLYFRGLDDYLTLWHATRQHGSFFVVGGGFIGAELAAALRLQDKAVSMAFPEVGVLGRVLPPDLSHAMTQYYRDHGVEVLAETSVEGVARSESGFDIRLRGGADRHVDVVVAGLGIRPNTDLAVQAGLQVDDGILVDDEGRTSHPDIFAAGDVARIATPLLGGTRRIEHEDNAVTRGRAAGINMAGGHRSVHELPFFYSDLFDLGFEAVGDLDPRLTVVADWVEPMREGVLYYLQDGRVAGVLNWNVWDGVPAARSVIEGRNPVSAQDLIGRIRNH